MTIIEGQQVVLSAFLNSTEANERQNLIHLVTLTTSLTEKENQR